jgi:hypothetical protein
MLFEVTKLYNGQPCPDANYYTQVTVERRADGLFITAQTPVFPKRHEPNTPPGRLDGLWDYDVSEIFFVGDDGKYLEVELGTRGHYLVLAFDDIRQRSNDFADADFQHEYQADEHGATSSILIPNSALPANIVKANAFLIAGGYFMAYSPLPGDEPDFHQPKNFIECKL